MNRTILIVLAGAILSALTAPLVAADKPIVGSWECTTMAPNGVEMKFTLTVKEEGGKLTGTAGSDEGEMPLTDPKYEDDTFTFKVTMDSETYDVRLKVSGSTLDGTWKGGGESGSIKGTKKA